MALNFKQQLNGITLVPQNLITPSQLGDIRYNSATNKLEVFDGVVDSVVTESGSAVLNNKILINATIGNSNAASIANTLLFTEISGTPGSNPPAGDVAVYVKTDGVVYTLNSSGVETNILIGPISNNTLISNISGISAIPSAHSLSSIIDSSISNVQGSILYRDSASWLALPPGSSGQVLSSGGSAANPSWLSAGSGTVTSVATGVGLTGGPITSSGTIALAQMPTLTLKGNNTGITANPSDLTVSQIQAMLSIPTSSSPLALNAGGTGTSAASANAAFNALSPMTTGGDLIYGGASGVATRLPNGSAGQFLKSSGGTAAPVWGSGGAGSSFNVTSQTTTYSASINDYIICSGSGFTITLPTAVGVSGQSIVIQHNGSNFTQYILDTTSGQTIGGIASGVFNLTTKGEALTLVSDNANWQILEHRTNTAWVNAGPNNISATSTPPSKGTATIPTDNLWWRRVGQNMEVRMEFVLTAPGTAQNGIGDYIFGMPGAQNTDPALVTQFGGTAIGNALFKPSNSVGSSFASYAGGDEVSGGVYIYANNFFRIGGTTTSVAGAAGTTVIGAASGSGLTGAVTYAASFSVPMNNWQP